MSNTFSKTIKATLMTIPQNYEPPYNAASRVYDFFADEAKRLGIPEGGTERSDWIRRQLRAVCEAWRNV